MFPEALIIPTGVLPVEIHVGKKVSLSKRGKYISYIRISPRCIAIGIICAIAVIRPVRKLVFVPYIVSLTYQSPWIVHELLGPVLGAV
jgi:hypothetical protein